MLTTIRATSYDDSSDADCISENCITCLYCIKGIYPRNELIFLLMQDMEMVARTQEGKQKDTINNK